MQAARQLKCGFSGRFATLIPSPQSTSGSQCVFKVEELCKPCHQAGQGESCMSCAGKVAKNLGGEPTHNLFRLLFPICVLVFPLKINNKHLSWYSTCN